MGLRFVFAVMAASVISLGPAWAQTHPLGVVSPSAIPPQTGASDADSTKRPNIKAPPKETSVLASQRRKTPALWESAFAKSASMTCPMTMRGLRR